MKNWTDAELFHEWDQRAAKIEHDGGVDRDTANFMAAEEIYNEVRPRKLPKSIQSQMDEDRECT